MYGPNYGNSMSGSAYTSQSPQTSQYCNSQLELSISARNLVNRDVISKSDPQCYVYSFNALTGKYIEIGRTEMIKDNLSPDWVKKLVIPFRFNENQQMRFEVWDVDPYSQNEFLGMADSTLGSIVAVNGGMYKQKLRSGGRTYHRIGGEIWVHAEEISANKQIVLMQFVAMNLDKKDFLGKSDPYLVISRSNRDGTFSAVHKTEFIKNTLNPQWRPFHIRVQALCNGDYDRTLKFDCYDWDHDTNHDLIGSFTTTLKKLTSGVGESNTYDCINPKKQQKKKKYKNSGIIKLNLINITEEVTFLDYVRGGTQMHFAVAIDFTASNGPPYDPQSLHRLDPTGENPNSYEIALKAVGEILEPYDTQGLMAAFGFGAKLPPHGQLSHHFPINNNQTFPYCRGINEILTHYKSILSSVQLHGPTNFAPTINSTASAARTLQDGKHYFVLLIITDGVISDMNETIDAIVSASTLPLSIIIVGVGNADFSAMEFLDSDNKSLVSRGKRASRDIVQFVPMRKYMRGHWVQNQFELARDVLAEVPTQFIQFMNSHGFKPGKGTGNVGPQTQFSEPTSEMEPSSSIYPPAPSTAAPGTYPSPMPGMGQPSSYPQVQPFIAICPPAPPNYTNPYANPPLGYPLTAVQPNLAHVQPLTSPTQAYPSIPMPTTVPSPSAPPAF